MRAAPLSPAPSAALRERTLLAALAGLLEANECVSCGNDIHCDDCRVALRNARDLVNAGAGAQGGH